MNIKKEYTNGEVTIIWQPGLCQHAGICTKTLPNVYHPKKKPWNKGEKELIAKIKKCPSGALSYRMNNEKEDK